MNINKIRIKGFNNTEDVEYDLSKVTSFYGNNGTGKSTIVQAIMFAIYGYVIGENKTNIKLHASCTSPTMRVELHTDRGKVVRELYKDPMTDNLKENFQCDFDINLLQAMPFDIISAFSLTANSFKDYILSHLKTEAKYTFNDIFSNVSDARIDDIQRYIELNNLKCDFEGIAKVNQYISAKISELRKEANIYKGIPELLEGSASSELKSDLDKDALVSRRAMLLNWIEGIKTKKSYKEALARLEDLCPGNMEDSFTLKGLRNSIKEINEHITELEASIKEDADVLNRNRTRVDILKNCSTVCSISGKPCEYLDSEYITAQINICNMLVEESEKGLEKANLLLYNYKSQKEDIQRQISELEKNYSQKASLVSSIQNASNAIDENKEADYLREVEELTEAIEKANAQDQLKKLLEEAKIFTKLSESIEFYKKYETLTDVNHWQTKVAITPLKELESQITLILQKVYKDSTISAHIEISDKRNSFHLSEIRDSKEIRYEQLSTGEKLIFVIALLQSLKADIICIDNLCDVDKETQEKLIESLEGCDAQIILTSITPLPTENDTIKTICLNK